MYKKTLLLLFSSIVSFNLSSQDFSNINAIVYKYPETYSNPKKLADQISKDFTTETEKAMAVYSWITKNVSYDFNESGKYAYTYKNRKEYLKKDKKYVEKISKRVISKGKAVCEGYSQLFKNICDHLGVICFVVSGKAKTQINDIGKRYSIDHAWNIVEINFKKYLIDVTWGAGYYDTTLDKFIKKPNKFYFGTEPAVFIQKHYPDLYENSLLKYTISKEEFSNWPLHYSTKESQSITQISPVNGILLRKNNTNQKIIFKYNQTIHSLKYNLNNKQYDYKSEIEYNDGEIELEFDLSHTKASELTIFINYQPVVGFKLK
ncbi:hypothetical protein AB832_01435 [Flavobacteriaceae bacterium (ex Bugula neritina AB1)]|nr:hypothetical protein AB832_01435 [Flavobacteriaceae bacterium (ex Bugula neritina AB1)]